MERTTVDGLELEYDLRGEGEPVVLIHWGVGTAWAEPLLAEPALAGRYRLLGYHRAGYAGSGSVDGQVSMALHAEHCRLLMRQLGIERAHIVGHSSSAVVALQLALDSPDVVHTIVSMEAARPAPQTEVQAEFRRNVAERAVELYRAGDTSGAVDTWCKGVFGPDYRAPLDRTLPGAFDQTVAEADAFFPLELPALMEWQFTEADASRITQPVLLVLGEKSVATFPERRDLLLAWLPNAEPVDVPGATHLLHLERPRETAEAVVSFLARHPLT